MRTNDDPGPRTVLVDPHRLAGWVERFAATHGPPRIETDSDAVTLRSPDGAEAVLTLPWGHPPAASDPLEGLVAEANRPHRFGVLLVRKGAHAVGVLDAGTLVASKIDTHYVQGRTKAGGWSQQRYARRRGHQADRAYAAAAQDAARVLLPQAGTLEALVRGGDAAAVAAVLADPALADLAALPGSARGVLPAPEPRLTVLLEVGRTALVVQIRLNAVATRRSAAQRHDGPGDQ